MLKSLRLAVTGLSLAACALLIALWVRSYSSSVFVVGHFFYRGALLAESSQGRVAFGYRHGALLSNGVSGSHWGIHYKSLDEWQIFAPPIITRPAFGVSESQGFEFAIIPYWFLTLLSMIAAVVLWNYTWRFRLRTLLIATTLVATVLGLVVAAM